MRARGRCLPHWMLRSPLNYGVRLDNRHYGAHMSSLVVRPVDLASQAES